MIAIIILCGLIWMDYCDIKQLIKIRKTHKLKFDYYIKPICYNIAGLGCVLLFGMLANLLYDLCELSNRVYAICLPVSLIMIVVGVVIAVSADAQRTTSTDNSQSTRIDTTCAQLKQTCENKILASYECIVSLLPPYTSDIDKNLNPYWEKDIYLGIAQNRKEAFDLMRDYLQFNRIRATDVTEREVNICDFDNNILETAKIVRFTCGQFMSANYDDELSENATFLIRTNTVPKYDIVPSFEDWCIINNIGKRRYYEFSARDRYAYRDISRYLESKSAKVGDD